ncbi:TetR/AcrR family transcriptional regulator [Streptomyces somaliensis DSM 40738]|uniref:TetR/AcrR family transcriptional regulator n=1 Tax=Streptomyces somaliensis (strain ATCC 33201 / DSM 40738 / JCM 12659 / KCTC 9044 / NCTC 11332 / NRRL B-12077 / IP 733) TaxID=1134445 RepID=A0AA44DDV7_STRE0|nr:TetR/AcrR family transcriptional regulator [Streptomyces somaliensis]MCQ0023640.1 TetR/AcrR family transcriptional regulator [Streptomyces somaliensis DSM 40738]NKY15058.1 TetR/AcrR family transcriptional regulator [Streptomyces somaliensis DSM 40738]
MAEGLRERKKRRTRQHISDVATGLFLERGFDAVTITEIAEAAEVSVNTVYNYFPAKEDLFLDRGEDAVDRLARWVRGRRDGESAAGAVLRELREAVETLSYAVGLFEGHADFMRVVLEAPTLRSRLWQIRQDGLRELERTLRAEVAAPEDDPVPALVAGQLDWLYTALTQWISAETAGRRDLREVSRGALALLDEMETLLGERVLAYAARPA